MSDDARFGASRVIWWGGLALCVAQLLTQIADGSLREFYFISDHLYVPTLFEDLVRWAGHLADWRLTPSPYLLPDMPLYAAFRALGASVECAQYGSGLTLFLLIVAAGRLVIRHAIPLAAAESALLAPAFALWIAVHAGRMVFLVAQLAVISCHGGAVAASFATLGLCFATDKRGALPVLCAIAVAAGASDPLYAVSCSIPLGVLALQPAGWRRRVPGQARTPERVARDRYLLGAAAGVAGVVLARFVNARSTAGYVQPRPARASASLTQLASDLWGPARIELVLMLAMLALAAWLLWRLPRERASHGLRTLAIWQITSLLATLTAAVLTGRYSGVGTLRYLLVPFTFGVVLATAALAYALHARAWLEVRNSRIVAAVVVALSIVFVGLNAGLLRDGQYRSDVREQAACVAAIEGVDADRTVLTDYWNAKPLRLLSDGRVRAVQMTEALAEPRWWISSRAWYRGAEQFGVIVTNALHAEAIAAEYGPPQAITHCGPLEVYEYRGEPRARLTHAMRAKFEQFLAASR